MHGRLIRPATRPPDLLQAAAAGACPMRGWARHGNICRSSLTTLVTRLLRRCIAFPRKEQAEAWTSGHSIHQRVSRRNLRDRSRFCRTERRQRSLTPSSGSSACTNCAIPGSDLFTTTSLFYRFLCILFPSFSPFLVYMIRATSPGLEPRGSNRIARREASDWTLAVYICSVKRV